LVDPYIPAYSPTAQRYQRLARASLAVENVIVDTSLVALYSIFGLCYYLESSDEKDGMEESMALQGIMVKIAQSVSSLAYLECNRSHSLMVGMQMGLRA
jgi:hypothetical protein